MTRNACAWRRAVLTTLGVLALAEPLAAQDFPQFGDELYRPRLRQPGKDVMWLPTPDAMVVRMLQAAKTTRDDIVYDLGAGDGRIPIAAAKEFGAKAVGIEYDKDLAALARRNAERAGVAEKVTIIQGDIFKEDFSAASVVSLYLLPDLNQQLRPQLLRMKPGTRVVSHLWDMGEWEPDDTLRAGDSEAFVWIVPAQVGGRWTMRDSHDRWDGDLDITQQFQRIGGTLTIRGVTQPLLGAYVQGATLGFTFVAPDGGVRSARARVDGSAFSGSSQFSGHLTPIAGRRTGNESPDRVGANAGNR
jgi:SAM-dependent methyltransferase